MNSSPVAGLELSDPFIIASSHWTAGPIPFKQLAAVKPSAVTLKTTSSFRGGDGSGKRDRCHLIDSYGHRFAQYTDGAPALELWDVSTTYEMTREARQALPSSRLGLSVLQQDDYAELARRLRPDDYDYVELNWKYSFRGIGRDEASREIESIHDDMRRFIEAFGRRPILVKLSREAAPYMNVPEFSGILSTIESANAALLVANSKKIAVPPSRIKEAKPRERTAGVVLGEWLFLDTYNLIREISRAHPQLPIVATGGVTDIAGIVDLFAAGAQAVQLCAFLDLQGPQGIQWLREQLRQLLGEKPLGDWLTALRTDERVRQAAVVEARSYRLDVGRAIDVVLSGREQLIEAISDALRIELTDLPPASTEESVDALSRRATFVVTRGNVSGHLLAERCVDALGLAAEQQASAGEFLKAAGGGLAYDYAILPKSAMRSMRNDRKLVDTDAEPIEIDVIARSVFELVGRRDQQPERIGILYHFGGASSRSALDSLLAVTRPDTAQITGTELLPLLRFWPERGAILAKPPLSRLYGTLARDDVRELWGVIWTTFEPLILVASRKSLSTESGERDAQLIRGWMHNQRRAILAAVPAAAREILSSRFLLDVNTLLNPVR